MTVPPKSLNAGGQGHPSEIIMIKAQQEVTKYLKTPKARDTIVADILNLSSIILSIEEGFAFVASQMTILDDKNILSHKFAPDWRALHEEYTALKEESRYAANDISYKIEALVKTVVPVLQKDIDLEDKKAILVEYIDRLKQFQPEARKNAIGFLRLGQKLTAFKLILKDKIESEKKRGGK
jgi:hypothetical protein